MEGIGVKRLLCILALLLAVDTAYGSIPRTQCAWRNRMTESWDGVWAGRNWYIPESAQRLAFDMEGQANGTSIGGHNTFDGNPIYPYWDPDGRFGKQVWNTMRDFFGGD